MVTLRAYQATGVNDVMALWQKGVTNVLFVMPTGGGKSVCLAEMVRRARAASADVLWMAHRHTLVDQAKKHIVKMVGSLEGIHVETIQTLLARGHRPKVGLVVADEAHHLAADDWGTVPRHYQHVRMVGATATPERGDGRPVGDIFQEMVVPTSYSQLIEQGHLVDCRVFRPEEGKGSDLAKGPVPAYLKYGQSGTGFCFVRTVEDAEKYVQMFLDAGISADLIVAGTPEHDRKQRLEWLRTGVIKMLVNVYTMTEGVDIPSAQVCILARNCGHPGTMIQMTGRVLRPHRDKPYGILIDLPGVTHQHGVPTQDREYSLTGKAITKSDVEPLRVCQMCGFTFLSSQGPACPKCGFKLDVQVRKPRIYDEELVEVFRGQETAPQHKERELDRLRGVAKHKNFSAGWVAREYKRLFKHVPSHLLFEDSELRAEYLVLKAKGNAKGYRPGWAANMYRAAFGVYPSRSWG